MVSKGINKMKIGIFDSGIGGLSIANHVWKSFVHKDIFYVADRAFSPYGEMSQAAILERSRWCCQHLIDQQVDVIIIACNTATAASIKEVREEFEVPIIGVEPDINFLYREQLLNVSPDKICVLCTSYTLNSPKFRELQLRRDPDKRIAYKGMKNLAGLIEQCFWSPNREYAEIKILEDIQNELSGEIYEYLVMGCTHYELVKGLIEKSTGMKCVGVASALSKRLSQLFPKLERQMSNYVDSCGQFFFLDSIENKWKSTNIDLFLSWPEQQNSL